MEVDQKYQFLKRLRFDILHCRVPIYLNVIQLGQFKWSIINQLPMENIKTRDLNKLDGLSGTVQSLCFQLDCTTLASGDKSIRQWDFQTGQTKAKFEGYNGRVLQLVFS
ncbi:unnamed protein product [Paramecium primaurelia]|uniref:Uncharacterized protein n=1 Tax=Paramecium primaurelia TaxID=5886 RepID=A0A8S1KUH9_PARPR|nr:unnamed protein product [Paramecium primaurelia]